MKKTILICLLLISGVFTYGRIPETANGKASNMPGSPMNYMSLRASIAYLNAVSTVSRPVTSALNVIGNGLLKSIAGNGYHHTDKATNSNVLRLTIARSSFTDETIIRFVDQATNGFDGSFDAYKMFSNNDDYPQVYSVVGSDEYAINSLPLLTANTSVQLGYLTENAGTHSITATDVSTFDPGIGIQLEDVSNSVITDLRLQPTYTFTTSTGTFENRFIVHFLLPATSNNTPGQSRTTQIYTYDKAVYIGNVEGNNARVVVYNMLGQEILTQNLHAGVINKINTVFITGQYIVAIIEKSKTTTQKVYIK